jgi:hypothetical protein
MGDGSPPAAVLAVWRGSRGGSTWPSGVVSVKEIHQDGEHGADASHRDTRLVTADVPWIKPSQEDGSGGRRRRMTTATSSVGGTSGGGGRQGGTSTAVTSQWNPSPPSSLTSDITSEVVLRHFHRCCYSSSPLWFFCWRELWSLGGQL